MPFCCRKRPRRLRVANHLNKFPAADQVFSFDFTAVDEIVALYLRRTPTSSRPTPLPWRLDCGSPYPLV